MPLDADETRNVLRKALKDEEQTKFLCDRFREKSDVKLKLMEIIESRAKESPALQDLATYVKHMEKDRRTMLDIQEALALNSMELREQTVNILKDMMKLHEMTDEDLKRIDTRLEQVNKDVQGVDEHKDILRWIDNYMKRQTNGDPENGR